MRRFYFRVWHVGYVSTISVVCEKADLVSDTTLKAKLCIALFDHGLPIERIEGVQSSEIFYQFKNELKPISHPMHVPNRAFLSLSNVVFDDDPDVFRVETSAGFVLPVEVEHVHMRSLSDIEFFVKRRLVRYGVELRSNSQFFMRHARWTLCTPTRRDFKYRAVQISPMNFNEKHFVKNVRVIQRQFRTMRRHRAARVIQHAWVSLVNDTDWIHLNQ